MRNITLQFLSKLTARQYIVTLLMTIFVGEMAAHELGIVFLQPFILGDIDSPWLEAIIDSSLLTLFVTPVVWKIMIHPLQDAVTNEKEHLATILKECADGIIVTNEEGVVQLFNRAAECMFGYTQEEIAGMNVCILTPSPYHQDHGENLKRYFDTHENKILYIRREAIGQKKDGSTFPLEIYISEIVDGDHRVFTGMVRDITSIKAGEKSYRRTAEQLTRFNRLAVGREKRMIELKREINDLLQSYGKESKYFVHDTAHDLEMKTPSKGVES